MHYFSFLYCAKICTGCTDCFTQVLFSFGEQKKWPLVAKYRRSTYTGRIVLELAWKDSALVVLDKWSSCLIEELAAFVLKKHACGNSVFN